MAEAGLLAGLESAVRLVVVLVHVLQEVWSQGQREWMRKIGVDHNNLDEVIDLAGQLSHGYGEDSDGLLSVPDVKVQDL